MRLILRQSNLDLQRELERINELLSETNVIPEIRPYKLWVQGFCESLELQVKENLDYLNMNVESLIEDILSNTQETTRWFNLVNEKLLGPILRGLSTDKLCLRVLTWLHGSHSETSALLISLSDAGFGVWPDPRFPTIYFMPSTFQRGLLYLPLFFHEFGHVLYSCHRKEMDDIVKDLQSDLEDILRPLSQRNDLQAQSDTEVNRLIVETWYSWAQEIFCDAVGLTMGGPAYLRSFSMYFRMRGRGIFHQPQQSLFLSSHPVTSIRISLIVDKAKRIGLENDAHELESSWEEISSAQRINKDFYGFFDDSFVAPIRRSVEDMITETNPYRFNEKDISAEFWSPSSTPVHLVNNAWKLFLKDPNQYLVWEKDAINLYLRSSESPLQTS